MENQKHDYITYTKPLSKDAITKIIQHICITVVKAFPFATNGMMIF